MNKLKCFGDLLGKKFDGNIELNYSFNLRLIKTDKNKVQFTG